jgi:hypothetical protein
MHDFVTDQNPVPIYEAAEIGLPEYAKVEVITPESLEHLPSSAFADTGKRLFPLHNKAAAFLSAVYFNGKQMTDKGIDTRIRRAVDLFKIKADVEKFAGAQRQKQASNPEGRFALSIAGVPSPEGAKQANYYPMNNYGDVVRSAEQLSLEYATNQIPCEWYHTAARELVKAAREFSVPNTEIPGNVLLDGEPRYPDFEYAAAMANLRKEAAGITNEALEMYHEVVKAAAADYEENPEGLDSWVNLWVDLDRTNGVHYSRLVADPYRSFYAGGQPVIEIEKMSRELVSVADVFIPGVVLAGWSATTRDQAFSKSASSMIASAQAIALENPVGAGEILDNLQAEEKLELLRLLSLS